MKKIVLNSFVCVAALVGFNAQVHANEMLDRTFTGPYVGVQGTYTNGDADLGGGDIDVDGFDYGVFVGFKADTLLNSTVNRLGLGVTGALEFDYNWSTADGSFGALDVDKNHDWGISLRPGLSVVDSYMPVGLNPYGIVGYRRAEFEGSAFGVSGDENYNGFELGLGTEVVAYGDFGVRVEYSHTWYKEKGDIDPSEHNFTAGVAYHF